MAAAGVGSNTSFTQIFVILALLQCCLTSASAQTLGVCYGMLADNLPSAPEVVTLYQSNDISSLRLYAPHFDVLDALRSTGIIVTLGVANEDLQALASEPAAADGWIATNVKPYADSVTFKYITVGNEVIPGPLSQFVLQAILNLQSSLNSAGLSRTIGVTTVVSMSVLGNNSFPPSVSAFSEDSLETMTKLITFLNDEGYPLLLNVYPYFPYVSNPADISLAYAQFYSPLPVVIDGNFFYQNLFDAMVDSVHAAMEKVGGSDVRLVISESGWPSAGSNDATIDNARIYINNLIVHVMSGKGTPRRPGIPLEVFIFAMFNEDLKIGDETERNFGLFYPTKQPVYRVYFP